ncbi:MAG: carbohydrate porin [Candidatus Scalindua rubra]|nr:carbohydrate porin [Candidatus Scalindua rubra]
MKYAYCLLRLFLIVLFLDSTFAMVIDGRFSKYVCAEERETVDDLFEKTHSTDIHDPRFFEHEHLFDFRLRNILEGKGFSFDLVYTSDFVTNHSGGLKKAGSDIDTHISYLSNTDLTVELDTEKAGFWKGGIFHGHLFNHHGADPSEDYIGDLQVADNFESENGTKLYEFWYKHSFDLYGTDLSLLFGQHDLNSEFNISEYGLLFLHSSFGVNNEISNNIPVANFPIAALGVRMKWEPTKNLYFMAEISDGDPGKNNCGTHIKLDSKDGFLNIFELGYHFGDKDESRTMPGTYKFGWWYHTDEFDDVRDTDVNDNAIVHDGNYGIYFIADQMLLPSKGNTGLGAFFRIGGVPGDRNEVDFFVGGGIHYKGIIPCREQDILGLAVAHAQISGDQRDAEDVAESDGLSFHSRDSHETAVELTYRTQLFPWLAIQPGVQTIFNPGADSSLDNAVVSIVRFQVNF